MEVADAWDSLLPDELLLDIFGRLGATAVMSCAGACKRWRRVMIGNASTLRPRADTFVPSLLLGFVPNYISDNHGCAMMQRTTAPSQPVLPETNEHGYYCSFAPAPACGYVLSSGDGFLLIKRARGGEFDDDLCLWNPVTGACRFLPMASFGGGETYILVTGYDDLQTVCTSSELEVRILAVDVVFDVGGRRYSFDYQVFSATSDCRGGVWGPVEHSQDFDATIRIRFTESMEQGTEVVCRGGAVHWLASWSRACPACTVALDARTGRTWTTEVRLNGKPCRDEVVLATSRDGRRLSVIRWWMSRVNVERQEIQVWELTAGGDQWVLRRVVDVRKLVPGPHIWKGWLNVFCPRSGLLRVSVEGQEFLIDVDRGSCWHFHKELQGCRPYQMDWSSYWILCSSKMKYF